METCQIELMFFLTGMKNAQSKKEHELLEVGNSPKDYF